VALAAAVVILRLPSSGPQLLALEITEASILEPNPATEANLEQFRRQGYHFHRPQLAEALIAAAAAPPGSLLSRRGAPAAGRARSWR
jgi:hypothetical protein